MRWRSCTAAGMPGAVGLTPSGELPEDVEMIAFDDTKGVFNYYVIENGAWNFHGDSNDMLSFVAKLTGSGEHRYSFGVEDDETRAPIAVHASGSVAIAGRGDACTGWSVPSMQRPPRRYAWSSLRMTARTRCSSARPNCAWRWAPTACAAS